MRISTEVTHKEYIIFLPTIGWNYAKREIVFVWLFITVMLEY